MKEIFKSLIIKNGKYTLYSPTNLMSRMNGKKTHTHNTVAIMV